MTQPRRRFGPCLAASATIGLLTMAACGSVSNPPAQASPNSSPQATSPQDWDQVVSAAKKEGKVLVGGPPGTDANRAFTEPFTQKFGIPVEYFGAGGPEFPPRIEKERTAGLYAWDVIIQGTSTLLLELKPLEALDPIDSRLLLPEVRDPANWRDGKLPYFDAQHTGLSYFLIGENPVYVNTQQVNVSEIRSWRDLLDPKWKGKIVVGRDPQVSGYGQAFFQFLYLRPDLGPDFIRELLTKQNLTMMRDDSQSARALANGQFAICVCSHIDAGKAIETGLPVNLPDARQIKEGTYVTSSNGNITPANRAPHPNAARVYINWVLSREGQQTLVTALKIPSMRLDAPTTGFQPWEIPQPDWIPTHTEEALKVKPPLLALLKQLSS